ncbi:MAG: calcium/sodium antiporter [Planctomycetales bacterium]|nr:calcium/sodium antiporter [Planctomycetales bacterium]
MIIAVLIVLGLAGLVAGGEILVRGASSLAAAANISPLVIGLTVVAFGTSAPELAVSVQSCLAGKTDLAIGNVVGSNISNLLLILGFTSLLFPLAVHVRLFKLDFPVMVVATVALWVVARDLVITRVDGLLLSLAMIAYFVWTVREGRKESRKLAAEFKDVVPEGDPTKASSILVSIVQVVAGLALLVGGSDWLVDGCVRLAQMFGVSELVIGLTVVAIGTSMPELATAIVAASRGHRDLAVGNVVGSNILNVLAVLGISAAVAPDGIRVDARALAFDIPLMIAISLACMPILLRDLTITRTEGLVMFVLFAAYLGLLAYSSIVGFEPTGQTVLWISVPLLASAGLVALLGIGRRSKHS